MKHYYSFIPYIILILTLFSHEVSAQKTFIDVKNIVDTAYSEDGRMAIAIRVPGKPPEGVTGPLRVPSRGDVELQTVPAFNWCFGCSATSAAMAAGYYDNYGYPNMYAGPTNNGIMPQTNAAWSDTVISSEARHRCPLSATGIGLDGRTTRGHIEDYWISYGSGGPDPWSVNGWTEHTHELCTGDFMKTSQWINPTEGYCTDGETVFWTWNNGAPMTATDLENEGWDDEDGGYGLKLFYESRGYTVTSMFNQQIEEEGLTYGFSFADYKAQIDAGRPVLIHVTDHTMLGYGYNDDGGNETIYIHDTWDWLDHQMDWAGTYSGLQHYGVTVVELQTSTYNVWTGDFNNYWGNGPNWSLGHIPTTSEHVIIPDNGEVCIVDASLKQCGDLDVYPGAVLRIMDETLEVWGSMHIYGELEVNDATAVIIVHGTIYWEDGSTIDINDQTSDFSPRFEVYGSWRYLEGSNVPMETGIVYFTGASPTSSYIWTRSNDSYFHHIRMEKGAGRSVYHSGNSTLDMVVEGNIYLDNGTTFRSNSSHTIEVGGYINILNSSHIQLANGTLEFNGNPSTDLKPNTGDYVNNLVINTGAYTLGLSNTYTTLLDINGYVYIQSGYFDPNSFTLQVQGNWYNVPGPSHFIQAGTRVIFDAPGHQYIKDSEDFNIVEANCTAAIRLDDTTTTVNVANYDWTAGGWDILDGTLNINDLADNSLYGVWYLNAGGEINVSNPGGWIDLNGEIHNYGGTMTISGGDDSYWAFSDDALIEMTAGTVDFIDHGIVLSSSGILTEDISGGRIRVIRGFNGSARSDFTPTGGMFEFYGTGDYYINQGSGNNFCFMEINKGASSLEGTDENPRKRKAAKSGTVSNPHPGHAIKGSGTRSNTIILSADLYIKNELVFTSGALDVSANNYTITIDGGWTNYVGDAGFIERQGTVIFSGSSSANINSSETFYDLVLDKTYPAYDGLELNSYDVFTILDDLRILDGCIEMNGYSDLIVHDSLVISLNAGLNALSDPGLEIWVGGHWYNYNTTYDNAGVGFNPGSSTVTFDGSADQKIYTDASSEEFYDLVIDKPSGVYFRPMDNISVLDDLTITSGSWYDYYTGKTHFFYDDFTVSEPDGGFLTASTQPTIYFMGTGDQYVDFPAAANGYLYNVYIEKTAPADRSNSIGPEGEKVIPPAQEPARDGSRAATTYLDSEIVSLNGGFLYITEGTLDLNGHYYRCTGNTFIYDGGTLSIDAGAWLEVGGSHDLRVYSGGTLETIGASGNEAMIKGHNNLEYDFYVYSGGTISSEYAIFQDMSYYGVYILSGGIIDASHPFDHCTFRYGSATAGAALLRIENNQTLTIDGATFPEASPEADYNVKKSTYDQGDVTFTNATGSFAGPLYENDPFDRIHWDGAGNWLGTTSTDWNTAANWGFDYVPDLTIDVYVGPGCPNYPEVPGSLGINTSATVSYYCRNLEIDAGGQFMLTSGSIYNYGDLTVNGKLQVADDLNAYNGSVTAVYDTIYLGNQSGYVGKLNLLSGSLLAQYINSHIFTETMQLHDGCDYNGHNGYLHIYNSGSAPATNTLVIQDEDSYFSHVKVESGTNTALSSCTYDFDVYYLQIYGDFTPAGFDALSYYCDVYGNLSVATGNFEVWGNGPYFQPGSMLTMSGGSLYAWTTIQFNTSSSENVTGGTITVEKNFNDNYGNFSPTGGTVVFNSGHNGSISGSPAFYNLDIDKSGAVLESGTEGAGAEITVSSTLDLLAGTFELNSGTVLDINGYLTVSPGAVLDANDAWPIEIYVFHDWEDYNTGPTGFLAGSGSIVTFDGTGAASLHVVREKSDFNKLVINSGQAYLRPGGSSNIYIKADTIDIQNGKLYVSGDRIEVDDLLQISGTLQVDQSSDTLIVHDIIWKPGSNDVVSDGKILVNGDWTWENGTNASITSGNTVYFDASYNQFIRSYDPEAAFYNLEVTKTGNSWLWIHSSSMEDTRVLGNMNVHPGCGFHVQYDALVVDGILDVMSGASMRLFSTGSLEVATDFTLNGYLDFSSGGNGLVHGMFDIASTGDLEMNAGTMCCDAPYVSDRGFCTLNGDLELSGNAVLEILYNHISIGSSFNGNITGGTIRVGGTFISNAGPLFQPTGGTLEYIGGVSSGTYIWLGSGNWLNNLVIDGGSYNWNVYSSTSIEIKKDLIIDSGVLNATTDTIYLGDDWTNNVGASGFGEGSGLVILNGTSTMDVQQINGETFYDLENHNTSNHIEIAGNTIVTHNYDAGAGGTACDNFITASTLDVQNTLILNQGTFALSTSAPTVTVANFDQGGTLQLTDGTFTANNLVENYIFGDVVLYNGVINFNQPPADRFDIAANIEIQNGTFNLIGGGALSYWPVGASPLTFEMSGGAIYFQDIGLQLMTNGINYNITGGSIKTVGDFRSNGTVSVFDPSGGDVQLLGASSNIVELGTGSYFHDLIIDKSGAGVINASSPFEVKNELLIKDGTFNTNGHQIDVGP